VVPQARLPVDPRHSRLGLLAGDDRAAAAGGEPRPAAADGDSASRRSTAAKRPCFEWENLEKPGKTLGKPGKNLGTSGKMNDEWCIYWENEL